MDFQSWCDTYELSQSTVDALKEAGFLSLKSCALLNQKTMDAQFKKSLNCAQFLLLQSAVESLSQGTTSGVSQDAPAITKKKVTSDHSDLEGALHNKGLDAETLLNILRSEQNPPTRAEGPQSDPGKAQTFDPFSLDFPSLSHKLYDIRDYVTIMPSEKDKMTPSTLKFGDFELTLPETKPKLDSITPLQYFEASLRILREMVLKEGVSLTVAMQYVGYLIKTANMGQRFQWKSVLKYDAEYRKTQAEAGFPFGADSSYMMQLFLREQPVWAKDAGKYSKSKTDPETGKPVCGQFNTSAGCKMTSCKYVHKCRICLGRHSATIHKDAAAEAKPKTDLRN